MKGQPHSDIQSAAFGLWHHSGCNLTPELSVCTRRL